MHNLHYQIQNLLTKIHSAIPFLNIHFLNFSQERKVKITLNKHHAVQSLFMQKNYFSHKN